ncbi:MAG: DNA polymerase III subunit gamma/tau, partial [Oscillospiraceae bacterium]|nr:DNA polymerase III subunit gamma/tau [Oscillospiraceae bacterium]
LQTTAADLGRSANRRVDAELCIIRLCDETLDESAAGLTARLAKLEERAVNGSLTAPAMASVVPSRPIPMKEPPKPSHAEEDLPPWEEPTVPEEVPPPAEEPAPEPVSEVGLEPTRPTAPTEEKKPEPAAQPAPTPPVGDFWPGMVRSLKGKIPMGEYSFLSNPVMVQGRMEGMDLVLWVQSDFIKTMIDKPGVLTLVNQEARSLVGGPGRAVVRVGEAPKAEGQAEATDPLDELLSGQFGDIITEE